MEIKQIIKNKNSINNLFNFKNKKYQSIFFLVLIFTFLYFYTLNVFCVEEYNDYPFTGDLNHPEEWEEGKAAILEAFKQFNKKNPVPLPEEYWKFLQERAAYSGEEKYPYECISYMRSQGWNPSAGIYYHNGIEIAESHVVYTRDCRDFLFKFVKELTIWNKRFGPEYKTMWRIFYSEEHNLIKCIVIACKK